MMDFADDFTYFSFDELLKEVKNMYRFNKHVTDIRLDKTHNNQPELVFVINTPSPLTLRQLGLPLQFRCIKTRLVAANQ